MIIDKKIIKEEDESVGYIDVIFESSNILKTTYFPKKEKLYIHFKRGGTYSYLNIKNNIYEDFENAESQGKYLAKHIKPFKTKFPFNNEFSLSEREINDINEIINNKKNI